jgi:hypothetical protein
MSKLSKTPLFLVALALIVAAVAPALAQPAGRWVGSGTGSTYPPSPSPTPIPIYPWQEWKADFIDGVLMGVWIDKAEDYGQFTAKMVYSTPTTATYKGKWTWLAPSGWLIELGSFEITFKNDEWTCEGVWTTNYNTDWGTIEGKRTE